MKNVLGIHLFCEECFDMSFFVFVCFVFVKNVLHTHTHTYISIYIYIYIITLLGWRVLLRAHRVMYSFRLKVPIGRSIRRVVSLLMLRKPARASRLEIGSAKVSNQ